jgi:hypothetical protein
LVLPFPDASLPDQYRTAIYGIPERGGLGSIKQERLNRFSVTMKLRELTA